MIPNWIQQRAYLSPTKVGLQTDSHQWTFSEIEEEAKQRALRLVAHGVVSKQRIAYLGVTSPDFVFWIYAACLLECEVVLLNTRLSTNELTWQITDSGVSHVFVSKEMPFEYLPNASYFEELPTENIKPYVFSSQWQLDQTLSIMYTSGTTGKPKGVRQTVRNHLTSAMGSALNLGLSEQDVYLCTMPLFHISGYSILMKSIIYGLTIYLQPKFEVTAVSQSIQQEQVTQLSVVTIMLQQLVEYYEKNQWQAPSTLRTVLVGGGAVSEQLLKRALAINLPVLQTYGMTETSSQTATLSAKDALKKIGSAGKPLFFNEIRIEGEAIGEIYVKGPHVTPGYIGHAARMQPVQDQWLPTGDLGYLDEDGYLFVVDRRSDLIISGGENIYPAEIENCLVGHPKVREAGVCGQADERWGEVPIAFVVSTASEQELREYCLSQLAKYKIPVRFYFVQALPRNGANKLMRRQLTQLKMNEFSHSNREKQQPSD